MARSAASDPLEKFRFIISWSADGESENTTLSRVGFHDMQMPKRSTNTITYREGVDPDINMKSPGLSNSEDVVLGRGLVASPSTGNAGNELYMWMSAVHNPTSGLLSRSSSALSRPASAASNKFRKDVTIKQLDREGAVVRQWTLFNAWPNNFVPGSDLDAGEDGDKSIETVTLAFEDYKEEVPGGTAAATVSGSLPA